MGKLNKDSLRSLGETLNNLMYWKVLGYDDVTPKKDVLERLDEVNKKKKQDNQAVKGKTDAHLYYSQGRATNR